MSMGQGSMGNQSYGQPRTGGQFSVQDSGPSFIPPHYPPFDPSIRTNPNSPNAGAPPVQPPWGVGPQPDWYPRPYNNPNRSTSGAPINNFPGLGGMQQMRTGGNNVQPDMGMPVAKPAPYQPQTGGQDYYQSPDSGMPSFQQPMSQPYMQQAQAPQAPVQSWAQQNAGLIHPQQMQDPGLAMQDKAGGSLQSQYPGLNPQQLARINQIGADPVGGGAALSTYLRSIGYPVDK